jgi:hypothetical protein
MIGIQNIPVIGYKNAQKDDKKGKANQVHHQLIKTNDTTLILFMQYIPSFICF